MTHTTFCYNPKVDALSQFQDFAFSRIWRVGDTYYGVRGDGIYKLAAPTDNSVTASVTLTQNNFGTDALKRLSYLRVDGDADSLNPVTVTTQFEQSEAHSTNVNDFDLAKRVKLGRGAKGRLVTIGIQSNSPNFCIRSMEVYPQVLQRGVV